MHWRRPRRGEAAPTIASRARRRCYHVGSVLAATAPEHRVATATFGAKRASRAPRHSLHVRAAARHSVPRALRGAREVPRGARGQCRVL